jgi:hypothetical protein
MKRVFFILLMILGFQILYSQAKKDTLFFNNGSRIIGELKKIKLGVVTFDPDDVSDITVQLPKLRSISASRTIFRIETTDHLVYFGQMIPYYTSQFVLIVQDRDTILLHLQDISVLYPFKDSFIHRFSGSVGLGFSYTRSSDFGQLNFNGKVSYLAKKEELSFSTSGIYTLTDSALSRDREEINLKNNYYFKASWFATLLVGYQKNLELGLDRRLQEGIGIGNKYLTSKHVYAWARTGMVLNQERSTENVSSGTLAELMGQMEFNFFRFSKPEVNFVLAESFYYSLSQSGRIRNDAEADLKWEIIKDLDLNITIYTNYDSKPPGETNKNLDFGTVFGLNFTF